MPGTPPLCHHGGVKSELRPLAAVAALLLPLVCAASRPAPAPLPVTHELVLPILVSIPKPKDTRYTLTPLERETVAACLVLEAACQGDRGMRAVMAVIRNRADGQPEFFVPTVLQRKQFSSLNAMTSGRESLWRTIQRAKQDRAWPHAIAIVDAAVESAWEDPTAGATHFTRTGERVGWTRRLAKTVTIGAHSFYR